MENEAGVAVRVEQPLVFQELVQERARTLHVNHDCVVHSWKSRGGGTCEECQQYLPLFLKVCLHPP